MKKLILLILTTIVISVTGCYDYEYGPNVSLRTKKGRLTNEWELKNIVKNNTDTIAIPYPVEISFEKDYSVESEVIYKDVNNQDSIVVQTGDWTFDNGGESLIIIYTDSLNQKSAELYTILKLTKEEFWISETVATDEYWYFFEEK